MRMKSILLIALMAIATVASAQRSNLNRAKSNYTKYADLKSMGTGSLSINDLTAAQTAIDRAIDHDKTMEVAETWVYYALIYTDLALLDTTETAETLYQKALEGRQKAISLDTEKEHEDNLAALSSMLAQYELNKGAIAWEENNFAGAYDAFEKGLTYLPGDTTLLYYAGIAAINDNQYDKAVAKYVELVPIDEYSNNRQIVLDASRMYLQLGDTTNALKYAQIAVDKHPEDTEIATHNIELNLMAGNEEGILATLKSQAERSPNDKTLQYYLGIAQASLSLDDDAIASYQKALSIDPDYLEANINLGAAILTKGINHYNETNNKNLPQAEYEAEMKKAYEIFDSALPYLEKAVALDSNSVIALTNLKQYYDINDNQAKSAEIQAQIDALR